MPVSLAANKDTSDGTKFCTLVLEPIYHTFLPTTDENTQNRKCGHKLGVWQEISPIDFMKFAVRITNASDFLGSINSLCKEAV